MVYWLLSALLGAGLFFLLLFAVERLFSRLVNFLIYGDSAGGGSSTSSPSPLAEC